MIVRPLSVSGGVFTRDCVGCSPRRPRRPAPQVVPSRPSSLTPSAFVVVARRGGYPILRELNDKSATFLILPYQRKLPRIIRSYREPLDAHLMNLVQDSPSLLPVFEVNSQRLVHHWQHLSGERLVLRLRLSMTMNIRFPPVKERQKIAAFARQVC